MAKSTRLFPITCNSTATFRVLGSGVSGLLDDVGVTKTADTGQIDWSTVSKPTTASTSAGYEIRSIPSSVGGDLYLKVSYDTASYSTNGNSFRLGLIVGTGSDGAGNITGWLFNKTTGDWSYTAFGDATVYANYAARWDGGFALALAPLTAASNFYQRQFAILDRTCTSDGTLDTAGIIMVTSAGSNSVNLPSPSGYSSIHGLTSSFPYMPMKLPYPYSIYKTASTEYKRPFALPRHLTPAPRMHKNFGAVWAADNAIGNQFTVNVLGTSSNFISLGAMANDLGAQTAGTSTDVGLAIRWE